MQYIQLQGQNAPDVNIPVEGSYNLFVDGTDGSIKLVNDEGEWYGFSTAPIPVTYEALRDLINDDLLKAGSYYTITDFRTCYDRPDYDVNGDPITTGNYVDSEDIKPIIVFAISPNALALDAFQPAYPKDKIKYDVSFNVTEVTSGPAFGRITERIDEFANRTDYDHRDVVFKRYPNYYYQENEQGEGTVELVRNTGGTGEVIGTETTFTSYSEGDIIAISESDRFFFEIISIESDTSMFVRGLVVEDMGPGFNIYRVTQDGITYKGNNISTDYTLHPTFLFDDETIISNYIGDFATFRQWNDDAFLLSNNVFGEDVIGNRIGNDFTNNTFKSDVEHNVIGDSFANNTILNDEDFTDNQIAANFRDNLIICDDFNDNIIGDNCHNNKFLDNRDVLDNQIGVGFNSNIIYDNFEDNHIGNGFSYNNIRGNFEDNQIGNGFYDNDIDGSFLHNNIGNQFESNDTSDTFERNQISSLFKANLIEGYFAGNQIGVNFKANEVQTGFASNKIGNYFFSNDIGIDFSNNIIADNFSFNQIENNFRYNRIGDYFNNNIIGDDFGFGGGSHRGNVIGNYFINNNIGEYFYDNTIADNFRYNVIGDYFQFNRVDTPLDSIDFTENLGRINGYESTPGVAGVDGTYFNVTGTTTGQGVNAQFTIGVSGGIINSLELTNVGIKYNIGDQITIDPTAFGGTEPLVITVTVISDTPMVYGYYNKTIQRDFDGTARLVAIANGNLYITQYITEPID